MDASHEHVVSLLTEFGEEFDLSLVLGMLPDDWSLKLVSNVLFRAVRNTLHKVFPNGSESVCHVIKRFDFYIHFFFSGDKLSYWLA